MTTADINYGSTLSFDAVPLAQCQVIDWPEIAIGKANTTNHGSGGYAESIPNGLVTLGDMTVSIICDGSVYQTIEGHIAAGTIDDVEIADAQDSLTCDGYFLNIKKEAADAQNPNVIKATVVIALTGVPTIGGVS